jgi:hypothetical protein
LVIGYWLLVIGYWSLVKSLEPGVRRQKSELFFFLGSLSSLHSLLGTEMKVGDHRFTLTGDSNCDRIAGEVEAQMIYQQLETRLLEFSRYRLKIAASSSAQSWD